MTPAATVPGPDVTAVELGNRALEEKARDKERRRRWYALNGKAYREKNRDRLRENERRHRTKNPGRYNEKARIKELGNYYELRARAPHVIMWRNARQRAKTAGVPFNIEISDVVIPATCPALGIPIRLARGTANHNSPSLDRVVPALGYIKGNVQVISFRANGIKTDATAEELRAVAEYVERATKLKSELVAA